MHLDTVSIPESFPSSGHVSFQGSPTVIASKDIDVAVVDSHSSVASSDSKEPRRKKIFLKSFGKLSRDGEMEEEEEEQEAIKEKKERENMEESEAESEEEATLSGKSFDNEIVQYDNVIYLDANCSHIT